MSRKGDDAWRRDEPESPCVRVCVIDPQSRLCIGCARTMEEIADWAAMTADARRAVLAALPSRAPKPARRGGRGGRLAR